MIKNTYVVDVVTGDGDGGVTNAEDKVGEVSIAVEDVSTVQGRFLSVREKKSMVSNNIISTCHGTNTRIKGGKAYGSAGDLGVVVSEDGSGQVDQGGAGVSNGSDAGVGEVGADTVSGGGELPVAGQLGDVNVGQVALVGGVDEAKVVGAGGVVVQVGAEDGLVEGVEGVGPEGGLGLGGDGVEAVEAETEETVDGRLGGEGAGDSLGGLDGLGGDGDATDGNGVGVDDTAGGGAVTVGNVPGVAGEQLGGGGVGGVVGVLAVNLGAGGEGGEDPEVRGARVKVQVEDLGGGTNGDGGHVGIVVGVDGGAGGAALVALGVALEGVLHGVLEPVRDGDVELEVGAVHGQGAVGAVVVAGHLVDRGAALLEVLELVAGRDGGRSSGAGEGSRGKGLGSDHFCWFPREKEGRERKGEKGGERKECEDELVTTASEEQKLAWGPKLRGRLS